MVQRKKRICVVVDTNVFVRNFKARKKANPNRRVILLWLIEKQLQLIVNSKVVDEYLEIFDRILGMDAEIIREWQLRFESDSRCTQVNLGRRFKESRDPDDNLLLATALAGKAEFLITNDHDLLDLPIDFTRSLPFVILTPRDFLERFNALM
jgi:uncharacterized protein